MVYSQHVWVDVIGGLAFKNKTTLALRPQVEVEDEFTIT